jgi:hypothetical protein
MTEDLADLMRGHHLFPHERPFAASFLRRQEAMSSPDMKNQGPEAVALAGAACATMFPGMLIAFAGMGLIVASRDTSPLGPTGSWLLLLGILVVMVSAVRLAQAFDAGRRFRSSQEAQGEPPPG